MIRTCLFDLGNVILHFCHERMCSQLGSLCGRPGAELRTLLLESGVQLEYERGGRTEAEFHEWFCGAVGGSPTIAQLRHAASDIFTLNEPMIPILEGLRAQDIRLVLLSNTCSSHIEFIREEFDVLDRFDELVLSYEVGAVKPEPAIFRAALAAARCRAHECFYTDDIPAYIEAARKLGVQADVFTGVEPLKSHLRSRGLAVEHTRATKAG